MGGLKVYQSALSVGFVLFLFKNNRQIPVLREKQQELTSKFSLPGTPQTEADNSSQVVLPVMFDGERAAGISRAGVSVLVRGTELNAFTQIDGLGVGRSALRKVSHRN